ncbi:hypothetical protein GQF01_27090 [Paenibacillus sp. 5J-6]|uniref:Uncharacterized protein n=1 Tax=Paenibacillus silvestris TaxID=2606219 RepID=A0A6L8V669_9BACL|nr:hypothetical protein [Paenibacillus silvestris]MZQ85775.1 hypothetical protein [Paenibacillus silvestris]
MDQGIIKETLESLKDYLPKIATASGSLAAAIQSHEEGWTDTLVSYLEGMGWITMAINGIQQLDAFILEGWDLNELGMHIDQLRLALEQQDFVTVCDLLQYEIQPVLESYIDKLQGVVH